MGIHWVWSVFWLAVASPIAPAPSPVTVTFHGAADVSAVAVIDAHLIAVADDEDNVLRIYSVSGGGPKATLDVTAFLQVDHNFPEADIEAAARVGDRIYWITSHGRNKDGKLRPSRYRFFATEVRSNEKVVSLNAVGRPYKTLLAQLLVAKSLEGLGLGEAAGVDQVKVGTKKKGRKKLAPKDEGLNIEGLCASADGRSLYIGFRNPIPKGRALIVPLENPAAVIEEGRPAALGKPLLWDLGGLGVRDLAYVEGLQGYFIIAGPQDEARRFALYRWSGKTEDQPVKVRDMGSEPTDFTPEALVGFGKDKGLLILSDDGSREVEVAGPHECKEGEYLGSGKCLNKSLLDHSRKTFRGLWLSID